MGIGAAIGGIASGLMGSSASDRAADAQQDAARDATALQREIYEDTTGRFAPYLNAGNLALQAYMHEMGLGAAPTVGGRAPQIRTITTPGTTTGGTRPLFGGNGDTRPSPTTASTPGTTRYQVGGQTFDTMEQAQAWANANPTGGTAYQGFTATPGYQFRVDQGNDSVNALAGARGGLNSGATMQALSQFNQGIASEEYGNYMGRLTGLTNMGTSAAANTASAGQNFANSAGQNMLAAGQAQANGYINSANAINGGISNALGAWQYQRSLGQ